MHKLIALVALLLVVLVVKWVYNSVRQFQGGSDMNVFVSYSHADSDFALNLASVLESDGYDVFVDNKIPIGNNIYKDIGKGLAKADAVIIIVSPNSNGSPFVANEVASLLSFFDRGKMPLVIPIVIGKNTVVPPEISRFNYIVIPYAQDDSSNKVDKEDYTVSYSKFGPKVDNKPILDRNLQNDAIDKVRLILAAHDEKIKEAKEEKQKSEAKIKTGLSKYIDEVFTTLKGNEKRNKRFAGGLYVLSAFALVATLLIVILFFYRIDIANTMLEYLVVYGIICLFITVILVSFSKMLFTLAKSFMVESIRCSDRIHAISFGKFFIEAYGDEATIEQILQAFSAWNYDNGGSAFRSQSSDDYDPKLSEYGSFIKK